MRPVPVEILDRDGDDQLTEDDIIFDIYTIRGDKLHPKYHFTRSELSETESTTLWTFPFLHPLLPVEFDDWGPWGDGDYNYGRGIYLVVPHFEFGDIGHTNGSDWYNSFEQKVQEHSGESAYQDGTTYTHLFTDNDNVVIQYWFYYPFNHATNRHEGDWEHINVIVDSQIPNSSNIVEIEYYAHYEDVRERNANTAEIVRGNDNSAHPVVYVSGHQKEIDGCEGNGGHGNFPHAGEYDRIIDLPGDNENIDENVDGQGLEINFHYYNNIELIPNIQYISLNSNQSTLTWMHFPSYSGHVVSHPSAANDFGIPLASWWYDISGFLEFLNLMMFVLLQKD